MTIIFFNYQYIMHNYNGLKNKICEFKIKKAFRQVFQESYNFSYVAVWLHASDIMFCFLGDKMLVGAKLCPNRFL